MTTNLVISTYMFDYSCSRAKRVGVHERNLVAKRNAQHTRNKVQMRRFSGSDMCTDVSRRAL